MNEAFILFVNSVLLDDASLLKGYIFESLIFYFVQAKI